MENLNPSISSLNTAPNMPHQPPAPVPDVPKRRRFKALKALIFALIAFLILGVGSAAAAYMVAYGKISIGNPKLQNSISQFIQDLPLTPKTTDYLLTKMYQSHQNIKSVYFDISLASSS